MKGNKLIVLVSSVLLLTISSGLLFYRNLFLMDLPTSGGKVDFEELRFSDQQMNVTALLMRKNLNADQTQINSEISRIKELLNIVTDINKNTPELARSNDVIHKYFEKKLADMEIFKVAIKDIKNAVETINPTYNELNKNNIKFSIDKRDFYQDCVVDVLSYLSSAHKGNEMRLQEDKKILGQILSYATTPNPLIQKFSGIIDTILKRTKEIDRITENFNNNSSISNEMNIVGKYYKDAINSKAHDGEIFLTMVFASIVLYLICIVIILKKLS